MQKQLYKSFLILSIPIIIQQVLSQSLVFVDQVMIGHLGDEVIAAIGSASQISFFYWVVQFGILSAGSIFISQYHGKKEHLMTRRVFGFMTIIALVYSFVFMIVTLIGSPFLFQMLYPQSPKTVEIGVAYTNVIALTYLMSTVANAFSVAMRSIEKTREPMIATSISIVANIIFNLLLIPQFGAIGSAYGTFLARVIELICILWMFKYVENPFVGGKMHEYWIKNKVLLKKIVQISIPVVLTEFIWALVTVIINLLYTQTGVSGSVASSISGLVISMQSVVFMGVASATAIMVGKEIGENGRAQAKFVAQKLTKMAFFVALILVVFSYFIGIPWILSFYQFDSETTRHLTYYSLLVVTFMSFFKLMNWFLFIGVFRAGGDTKFALFADVGLLVIYALPAVLVGLYVFHLPVYMLIFIVAIEEILKSVIATWRYLSGKWIHDVTRDVYHV